MPAKFSKFTKYVVLSAALSFTKPAILLGSDALSYGIENKDEAFLVRRIAEFWKDQDYNTVREQITDFLEKYPNSTINDNLLGILGDLLLQENEYENALSMYQKIKSSDVLEKITINKLQCYYELNQFNKIIEEGEPWLTSPYQEISDRIDELHFLVGEAYFRTAISFNDENKKIDYLAKAKPIYEKIINSSFNDPVTFALAEIYRLRNENEKAASLFKQLAKEHKEQKEELLFHAALAQSQFDKNLAIETFSEIIKDNSVLSKEAQLNRLILFFQENRFQDVIEAYQNIINKVDVEKQNELDYIIGRSYFAIEGYEQADKWLEKYISLSKKNTPEFKNTLLMQLNCAQHIKDENKYKSIIVTLKNHFPEDDQLPQAIFIHAMMLKEIGDFEGAESKIKQLLSNHLDFDDKETLLLEYGIISYNNEKWEQSRNAFSSFLSQFPDNENSKVAWKYLLANSLNLLKYVEDNVEINYTKQTFYEDLTKILETKNILSQNELKECLFLQGKTAYELDNCKDALKYLNNYLGQFHDDISTAQAHLLIALCHHKMGSDPQLFCGHAETALKADPNLKDKSSIHLELYNAYLSIIETCSNNNDKKLFYDMAAEHIYQAIELQELPIKLENKLWLANFYYNKISPHTKIYETDGTLPNDSDSFFYKRSKSLFEKILIKNTEEQIININENETYLEWEIIKLTNFAGREKLYDKKIKWLTDLIEQQSKNEKWGWKLKQASLIELAKTYELSGRIEDAYETFKFISKSPDNNPSFESQYALLQSLRLQFMLTKPNHKMERNSEVLKALNELKELQIKKSPLSEPLHIEAALEYAWIRGQLSEDSDKAVRYLFFLNRIKEDFDNLEDPMIINYNAVLKENEEKLQIFNTYMSFLELEINRCEAILDSKAGRTSHAIELREKVTNKLNQFVKTNTSYYLNGKIKRSLLDVKQSKI